MAYGLHANLRVLVPVWSVNEVIREINNFICSICELGTCVVYDKNSHLSHWAKRSEEHFEDLRNDFPDAVRRSGSEKVFDVTFIEDDCLGKE